MARYRNLEPQAINEESYLASSQEEASVDTTVEEVVETVEVSE